MFQHWINVESYPVSQLYVNTLLAVKVTLITDGIKFGGLRVNSSYLLHLCDPEALILLAVRTSDYM
jgi:hypothetical protein